ncbi:MAG TPA: DivIVA domain-containing protein [Actinomycetota bacterium]|jgi:DivIVA domain-containing protein|nr:DivIVA domain-containing protein [Actinomycetota bacterium]
MPTSDLDMPLLPSAEQIRRREFATVRRGYDPQQVRTYLASIAKQVGTLERELNQLRLQVGSAGARGEQATDPVTTSRPAPAEDPYDALSKRFAALIEMADGEAERILENARSEAAQALDEATSEADRIRVDAQAHAEEARQEGTNLLERAKTESDRVLSGLAERRRGLVTQLEEMRSKLVRVAEDLTVPIEEAARADATDAGLADRNDGAGQADDEGEATVDPRYEDLWVNEQESLEIPDLAAIDLDLEEREE